MATHKDSVRTSSRDRYTPTGPEAQSPRVWCTHRIKWFVYACKQFESARTVCFVDANIACISISHNWKKVASGIKPYESWRGGSRPVVINKLGQVSACVRKLWKLVSSIINHKGHEKRQKKKEKTAGDNLPTKLYSLLALIEQAP